MSTSGPRIDWSTAPVVTVHVPTCAHCGATKYTTQRSDDNGDGSRTKLAVCRACDHPFKIAVEIPEVGNVTWPLEYDVDTE